MADAAMAAKADGADGAAKAKLGKAGTAKLAKAKAGTGVNVTDNGNGTYTVSGHFDDGGSWSKTFISTEGSSHSVGHADPTYVAKVKAHLSKGLGQDHIGQDTNGDGMYKGKSLEAGKGGRSAMMRDRLTHELVQKGYSHEDAESIARHQAYRHGVNTYGKAQMDAWAKASHSATQTAKKAA